MTTLSPGTWHQACPGQVIELPRSLPTSWYLDPSYVQWEVLIPGFVYYSIVSRAWCTKDVALSSRVILPVLSSTLCCTGVERHLME